MPYPSTSEASGIWSLKESRDEIRGDNWPAVAPPAFTNTYVYTGAVESYEVPSGITQLTFKVWGAAGGSSTYQGTWYGGSGAFIHATVPVTEGETLYISVGEGGTGGFNVPDTARSFGGGGQGAYSGTLSVAGRGGGGYSGVSSTNFIIRENFLIMAGGGGGSSGGWGGHGGPGGYPNGLNATASYSAEGANAYGRGALQTGHGSGGTGGRSTNGISGSDEFNGGNTPTPHQYGSGAGGGGYFGGGSGALYYSGGGGGSSWLIPTGTLISNENGTSGLASTPGSTDPDYSPGIAAPAANANGGNGLIVMIWEG